MARIRRTHFICVPCRASWTQYPYGTTGHICPRCAGPLTDAGTQFAAPRRRDDAGWRALTAVLAAGLRFHPACRCCDDGPG